MYFYFESKLLAKHGEHPFNFSTWEVEVRVGGQSGYIATPCLKKNKKVNYCSVYNLVHLFINIY
jgi:hypothetical protein